MNYEEWLNTLTTRIKDWTRHKSSSFECFNQKIAPPSTAKSVEKALAKLPISLPQDLIDFYRQGSSHCDVAFKIKTPGNFRYAGTKTKRAQSCWRCGFGVESISKLAEMQSDFRELIEQSKEDLGLPKKYFSLGEVTQPFWMTKGGDLVVWIGPGSKFKIGIYCVLWDQIEEGNFLFRYADSFSSWLQFLEENCYVGPAWWDVEAWHDGRSLKSNPAFAKQLKALIEED